jgi:putative transcriptional regulator
MALFALALLPAAPSVGADEAASPRSLLLVASNRITDAHFSRSVVLVTHHGGGGPLGIILNRPTDLALADVFDGETALQGRKDRLFVGGPVSRQTLVFLLRADPPPQSAVEVLAGLFMSLDAEEGLRRLRESDGEVRVFAGYSGWAPGQLEKEIARGDWHLLPADADSVFSREPGSLWEELVRRASLKAVRHDGSAPRGAPTQVRNRTADTPGT